MEATTNPVAGVNVEVWQGGDHGRSVLYLHPGDGFDAEAPFVDELTRRYRVIAPSHPGFGRSELPSSFKTIDDLAYFYLDFMEDRNMKDVVLIGASFGAWIAAEIAIKSTARIAALILVDALGAKFAPPATREIADLFMVPQYEQAQLLFEAESLRKQSYAHLPDDVLVRMARNHESFCLYGWSPTLHDPKLAQRLHRIDVPTHVIWGEADRVVSTDYGRSYARAIRNATFESIPGAGHYPQVEQPERFVAAASRFIDALDA